LTIGDVGLAEQRRQRGGLGGRRGALLPGIGLGNVQTRCLGGVEGDGADHDRVVLPGLAGAFEGLVDAAPQCATGQVAAVGRGVDPLAQAADAQLAVAGCK